ncbi:MAG: hypothetical protein NW237_07890 [Cyanobacteriota bacterium]|nr:hypothetical protein [Cyanobacteriota bacterium]
MASSDHQDRPSDRRSRRPRQSKKENPPPADPSDRDLVGDPSRLADPTLPLRPAENITILQGNLPLSSSSPTQGPCMASSPASQPDAQSDVDLHSQLETAIQQRQRLEARLLKLEAQLQERQQTCEHLTQEVTHLRQTLSQHEIAAQKRREQFEMQQASQSADLVATVALREQAIDQLQAQVQILEQQLASQEQKLQTLAQAEAHLQTHRTDHHQLLLKVSDLESQVAARQKLNERQRQDIETLQEQLQQQQLAMAQERRQWETRQQETQVALIEAQDLAQKRVDMLQRFKAELSLARTQIAETQQELSQLKSLHANQQAAWLEQREHLEARLAGYAETESEIEQRWQEQKQEWQTTLWQAQAQIADLNQRLSHYEQLNLPHPLTPNHAEDGEQAGDPSPEMLAQLASLQAQVTEYQTLLPELLSAQSQVKHLEQENSRLAQELSQQSADLERQTGYQSQMEAEIQILKEKITEQQQHHLRLKLALERSPTKESVEPTLTHKPPAPPPQRVPRRITQRGIDLPGFLRS